MRELWEARGCLWPTRSQLDPEAPQRADVQALVDEGLEKSLECNDVQFQLCEADKFFRAMEARGNREQVLAYLESRDLRMFKPSTAAWPSTGDRPGS